MATERADLEDAYLSTLEARLLRREGGNGLVFDRSNFYPEGGGQPGDTGFVERADGSRIAILGTRYGEDRSEIVLLAAEDAPTVEPGETLVLHVDWQRRYRMMRMHTACHLLTVVCPYPVTGAAVGPEESRIDFDIPDADADKAAITERLMALVAQNHPVFTRWITDAEFDANPGLVKSANVKPPRGSGRIRLVCIGEEPALLDAQPCGGTHVLETQEIGEIHVGKIEKKGKVNRRMRLRFGPPPAA
ncbi:alanyl-tRNA editing protein [Aurantimonas sp. Leaf443]|uniref:alanyl-tRNA editing protein n=1 Tax=Aurantimonas sp. Leaf443 TaxID=1736378 RepID=UPI0006FCB9C5|nr:alanyl-tRNA editing protein [Aurantimonas sp. Leaf443]KQT88491.1 Ala-tRNA(Pro) hydrolase [Aurantimonas sp. Leaf443]